MFFFCPRDSVAPKGAQALRASPLRFAECAKGGAHTFKVSVKKKLLVGVSMALQSVCGYSTCPRLRGGRCPKCERTEYLWWFRRMEKLGKKNERRYLHDSH
jgi:hypothetical protein